MIDEIYQNRGKWCYRDKNGTLHKRKSRQELLKEFTELDAQEETVEEVTEEKK